MVKLLTVFLAAMLLTLAAASAKEWKIDLQRADRLAEQSKLFEPEVLRKAARFYAEDPAGQKAFRSLAAAAARDAAAGDFRMGKNTKDYISALLFQRPAWIWFLTGDPEIGKFLHDKMLDIARRPMGFWMHESRFKFNPEHPIATLITGHLVHNFAMGLDLGRELFTPAEQRFLEETLRTKGLMPIRNFFKARSRARSINNWYLVVGSGMLYTAKLLGDGAGVKEAVGHIRRYTSECIEDDGSYGEGVSYLTYPVSVLSQAVTIMTPEQRRDVLENSNLARSWEYLCYNAVLSRFENTYIRLMFRDGMQFGPPASAASWLLGIMYQEPAAIGFFRKFKSRPNISLDLALFEAALPLPEAGSVTGLPRLRAFNNGETYLRSGWEDDGAVFGLLSGGRNRTGFSHDRPARNGIMLAACGEYLVVSPGSSSYRSRTYSHWDTSTRANNCITLNGRNQLFPEAVADIGVKGIPEARVLVAETGRLCDFIVSDATGCYPKPVREALRAVVFVRDPGYFVVFDRFAAAPGSEIASWFHFNNVDKKGKFTAVDRRRWRLERPKADLEVFFAAAQPFSSQINPGVMHREPTYRPDDPRINRPGTSFELGLTPDPTAGRLDGVIAFFPAPKGQSLNAECDGDGRTLTVRLPGRTDRFTLDGGRLTADIGGKIETVDFPSGMLRPGKELK